MTKPLLEVGANGKLKVNFHAGQLKAWDSTRRIVAVIAGTQSGKTEFSGPWLWREMQRCGPGDYGYVSPTYKLMEKKALPVCKTFFQDLLKLGTVPSTPGGTFNLSEEGEVRLWGKRQSSQTKIHFGYATNPESLESATWKAAVLDEAGQQRFKGSSYEAVMRRLSIAQGRVLIGTTPYMAGGWLKVKIFDRWKAGDPGIEVVNFASNMNPAFPEAEWERAKRDLPAWKFALFYKGELTRPVGLIYDCFDTAKHMARRFPIPASWPRYIGLDFGAVNTAAVKLAAELNAVGAPSGRLFLYQAYYPARHGHVRLTPAEHVKALLEGETGVPTAVGGSASEDDWRGDFGAAGLFIQEPKIRDVEVGIDRVYGAIKRNEIVVFDDVEDFQDEVESYSRELDDAGEPTKKIAEKEKYHILDSARYIVGWLKEGGEAWDATPDPAARLEVARAGRGVFIGSADDDRDDLVPGESNSGSPSPLWPATW
jgi:hypothetical protein